MKTCFLSLAILLTTTWAGAACQIKKGEQATFYPTLGSRGIEPYSWQADVHIQVSRKEDKPLAIRFAGLHYILKSGGKSGHIRESVLIPDATSEEWITYEIPNCKEDSRTFNGKVWLAGAHGVTVISQIEEPGLAKTFEQWSKEFSGVFFYYLFAGPWENYEGRRLSLKKAGFPEGILEFFEDSEKSKTAILEALFQRYPYRRFILIGDASGKDPEIYGTLARSYPAQIQKIYIRQVGEESPDRWKHVFKDVLKDRWQLFANPAEVK